MKYRLQLVTALMVLIAACTQPGLESPSATASAQAPPDFSASVYAEAAAQGQRVLRINPHQSQLVITVRRGGTLAKLGHDHVVASRELQGYIAPEQGRADLYLALDSLAVDDPALRSQANFDTQPSAADIAATRANMLGSVLQATQFPFALIRVRSVSALAADMLLALDITLHGVTRSFSVPARIDTERKGLHVTGELALAQSSFGITPLSILGGAIQVQDRVELRFDLRAHEVSAKDLRP